MSMTAFIETIWKNMVTQVYISKGMVRSAMVVEFFTKRAGELFAVNLMNFCNLTLPNYSCMSYALTELLATFPFPVVPYGCCTMFGFLRYSCMLADHLV